MINKLRHALERAAGIVAGVSDDRLHAPTPCGDWDARTLMNHLVAGNVMFAEVAGGGALDLSVLEQDHLGGDPAAAYRRSAELVLAAWQRPGVMDEQLSFGGMPGSTVIGLHFTEELVHGWDLATATGQDASLDPELSERALGLMRQVPPELLRSGVGFGAEVPLDDSAPAGDRLVAFLGRDPTAAR